jgi:hypothetical protein
MLDFEKNLQIQFSAFFWFDRGCLHVKEFHVDCFLKILKDT